MSAYASPDCVFPAPLTSADIASLFGKRPGWFDRHRVGKRLNAKGFRIHSGTLWGSERPSNLLEAASKWLHAGTDIDRADHHRTVDASSGRVSANQVRFCGYLRSESSS